MDRRKRNHLSLSKGKYAYGPVGSDPPYFVLLHKVDRSKRDDANLPESQEGVAGWQRSTLASGTNRDAREGSTRWIVANGTTLSCQTANPVDSDPP